MNAALPVITGLVVGIAFVMLFSLLSVQLTPPKNIDVSKHLEIRERAALTENEALLLQILLQNATIQELFEGHKIIVTGIGDMGNRCSFGNCGRIDLHQQENTEEGMRVLIDYTNHRFVHIAKTDGW